MKQIASILLTLALLLSAADAIPQPSPAGPSPRKTVKHHGEATDRDYDNASASRTPVAAKSDLEHPADVATSDKNEPQPVRIVTPIPQLNVAESPIRDLFDYALPILTVVLAVIAAFQLQLLYWTYIAQYRPQLSIHHMGMIKPADDLLVTIDEKTALAQVEIAFVLKNQGGSRAKIVEGNLTLKRVGGRENIMEMVRGVPALPEFDKVYGRPVYSDDKQFLSKMTIGPAQTLTTRVPLPEQTSIEDIIGTFFAIAPRQNMKHVALYVLGYVRYRDWTKREYVTAFCRRYDPDKNAFFVVEEPGYEYVD